MTLRARLIAAVAVLVIVLMVAGVWVVQRQQAELIAQVDRQLVDARPLATLTPELAPIGPPTLPLPTGRPDTPISLLFLAVFDDEQLRPVVEGALLDDAPNVSPADVIRHSSLNGDPFTAASESTGTRFRVLIVPILESPDHLVLALPLTDTDDAVKALAIALTVAGLVAVSVLLLIGWWVAHLGLRPMERVTDVAQRVIAGDRSARVDVRMPSTEAGKLGHAVNNMLDERDAADRRVRQFVADASHELRTPLTSVRGYLDMWADDGFTSEQQIDVVRRLRSQTRRMNGLVEDLLLLAHLDQGRPLRHDLVDLAAVAEDAARDAQAVQPARPISMELGDQPLPVVGDDARLRQVVAGLVHNALVHTPVSAGLSVSARRGPSGIHVVVSDEGPGIPAELLPHVFDRFSRTDPSRGRDHGGSGLGLAIAKSIVDAHHGTLTVSSSRQGTTFVMTLPTESTPENGLPLSVGSGAAG
jgi:two-component system, OmpR family, sensor kinase